MLWRLQVIINSQSMIAPYNLRLVLLQRVRTFLYRVHGVLLFQILPELRMLDVELLVRLQRQLLQVSEGVLGVRGFPVPARRWRSRSGGKTPAYPGVARRLPPWLSCPYHPPLAKRSSGHALAREVARGPQPVLPNWGCNDPVYVATGAVRNLVRSSPRQQRLGHV